MALSFLDNGTLRIGCYDGQPDTAPFTGGSVGWFGQSGGDNRVDNTDEGRQIQQSYYGATPDYLQPGKTWWTMGPWPWNPTQTHGEMIEFSNDGTTIYSRCKPFDWASSPELMMEDCVMEQWTTLQGNVAKVRCRLTYLAGGPNQGLRGHEVPAMFLGGQTELVTYEGNAPWTGDTLTRRVPRDVALGNEFSTATERWWAYVYLDVGVGLYVPCAVPYDDAVQGNLNATFYTTGNGSYVAPLAQFVVSPGCSFEYVYYLTYGATNDIRATFAALHAANAEAGAGWLDGSVPGEQALFVGGVPLSLNPSGALAIRLPNGQMVNVDAGVNDSSPVQLVLPNGRTLGLG